MFLSQMSSNDVASTIHQSFDAGHAAAGARDVQQDDGGVGADDGENRGRAVQLVPMNPALKAPVLKSLRLKGDKLLSK
jgi:hypothetical protein